MSGVAAMSDLLQPASLASWPELGAELPASNYCFIFYIEIKIKTRIIK